MGVLVTPEALRAAANQAELRGEWDVKELLEAAGDRLIQLEGQNAAYRHALQAGVSVNVIAKQSWFKKER